MKDEIDFSRAERGRFFRQDAVLVAPVSIGSVVYLKSGGPPMTVTGIEDGAAVCEWFDKAEKLRSSHFALAALSTQMVDRDGQSAMNLVTNLSSDDANLL